MGKQNYISSLIPFRYTLIRKGVHQVHCSEINHYPPTDGRLMWMIISWAYKYILYFVMQIAVSYGNSSQLCQITDYKPWVILVLVSTESQGIIHLEEIWPQFKASSFLCFSFLFFQNTYHEIAKACLTSSWLISTSTN